MDELDIGWILVLWFWALGLGGIEIEIEGGHGWAERLPTWYRRRGRVGTVFGRFLPATRHHHWATAAQRRAHDERVRAERAAAV